MSGGQAKDLAGIAERLKQARERASLSQRQLVAATGGVLTAAYVSRLEAGDRSPSYDALRALAGPLGVTPEWLETGVDGPALGVSFDAVLRNRALDAIGEAERALQAARQALVAAVAVEEGVAA